MKTDCKFDVNNVKPVWTCLSVFFSSIPNIHHLCGIKPVWTCLSIQSPAVSAHHLLYQTCLDISDFPLITCSLCSTPPRYQNCLDMSVHPIICGRGTEPLGVTPAWTYLPDSSPALSAHHFCCAHWFWQVADSTSQIIRCTSTPQLSKCNIFTPMWR